jgi:hypothetical protein
MLNVRPLYHKSNRQLVRHCAAMVRCTEMPTGDVVDAALSVPPPADYTLLGAWVEHIAAPREDLASLIVAEALKLPQVGGTAGCPLHRRRQCRN